MAIDYGTRATGVAISDELRFSVRPLTTLRASRGQTQTLIERITALVLEYGVGTVIVGLPLRLDGTRGDSAIVVEKFSQRLQNSLSVPVLLRDERLTSRAADERLRDEGATRRRRRADSDQVAAAILLEDYLMERDGASGAKSDSAPPSRFDA